jgi:ABC-type transport system involved in cytochrome c biogenesis permease component
MAFGVPLLNPEFQMKPAQAYVLVLILLSAALTSARSFRQERQNGVWEMLLVSPLSTRELVGGRLVGIWAPFLPAVAVILVASLWRSGMGDPGDLLIVAGMFSTSLIAVTLIGVCLALRVRNLLVAWLGTCAFGVLWPMVLSALVPMALQFTQDHWHWWRLQWLQSFTEQHPYIGFWIGQAPMALICACLSFRMPRRGSGSQRPIVDVPEDRPPPRSLEPTRSMFYPRRRES